MRAVLQRTLKQAQVEVENEIVGSIDRGLVVYIGIEEEDDFSDIEWMARKIINMRIFSDESGKMNLSLDDIKGGLLVISQFTLYASTKKGNRPSYLRSAKPEKAQLMYDGFIAHLKENYDCPIAQGIFATDMQVSYQNNGPVTILIDTKNKE